MEQVGVTVVIAPHDRHEFFRMALAHLEHQTYPAGRFEVLVVNAQSGSQVPEIVEQFASGSPVRVRTLDVANAPPPQAMNRAAEAAQGRWLLFLDEDVLAGPECVAAHVSAQDQNGGDVRRGMKRPNKRGRTSILAHYLKPLRLAPGLDVAELAASLASATAGASGADLEHLCLTAARICVKETVTRGDAVESAITEHHIHQALRECFPKPVTRQTTGVA